MPISRTPRRMNGNTVPLKVALPARPQAATTPWYCMRLEQVDQRVAADAVDGAGPAGRIERRLRALAEAGCRSTTSRGTQLVEIAGELRRPVEATTLKPARWRAAGSRCCRRRRRHR